MNENLDDLMPINDYAEYLFQLLKVKAETSASRLDDLFERYTEGQAFGELSASRKRVHKSESQTEQINKEAEAIKPQKKKVRARLESIFQ